MVRPKIEGRIEVSQRPSNKTPEEITLCRVTQVQDVHQRPFKALKFVTVSLPIQKFQECSTTRHKHGKGEFIAYSGTLSKILNVSLALPPQNSTATIKEIKVATTYNGSPNAPNTGRRKGSSKLTSQRTKQGKWIITS